jgi:hypothetical protein
MESVLMDETRSVPEAETHPECLEVHRRISSRGVRWGHLAGTILGLGLIGAWVGFLVVTLRRDSMIFGTSTWIPVLPFLAGDFRVHVDHVARLQAAGIDPHQRPEDWICALYPYPPMIGRLYYWVRYFEPHVASAIWQGLSALLLAAGGLAAWRTRRELGIAPIPLALIIVGVIYNTPALFLVERGQIEVLVLLPILASAWLLRRHGSIAELIAGGLLGAAAWVKYYPGVAVVALIALGRRKATAAFVVVAALIGIVDYDGFRQSVRKGSAFSTVLYEMAERYPLVHPVQHSISHAWGQLAFVRPFPMLRQIPGVVVAALLLVPLVLLVSRKVARAAHPEPLIYPLILWLTAAATFGLPYSNDYNLTLLPIAALAVWDRRDRPIIQIALGWSIIGSQPVWLPVDGQILLLFKVGALYAIGGCLAARAAGVDPTEGRKDRTAFYRPAFARAVGRPGEADPVIGGPAPDSRST